MVTNDEHTISFLAIDSVYNHFQEVASDNKLFGRFNDRNFRIENTKRKSQFKVKKVLMEMEKPIERKVQSTNRLSLKSSMLEN
ncbi:MAG: hypothetical protein ACM3X1_03500 [Ignavibacteriales bacterium]